MTAAEVARIVEAHRFSYADEWTLQESLGHVIAAAGATVRFEVQLTTGGRIDLMAYTPSAWVGVEVKIDGTVDAVSRQVARYLAAPEIDELVLVTSRVRHLAIEHPGLRVVTLAANGL